MAVKTVIDPLGRSITLHDHTWHGHVLPGHPEMARHRTRVERTIAAPNSIHFSAADADCRLYFGPGPRKGILIVVVANVVEGFVKTAHIVRTTKGVVEWSKPMP
jgi:hypothetical protein